MSWPHLLWDIASVWAICAGCLVIFIAVLKAQQREPKQVGAAGWGNVMV